MGSASVSGSENSFTLNGWCGRNDVLRLVTSGESSSVESSDVPDDSGESFTGGPADKEDSFTDELEDIADKEDCAIAQGPVSEGDSGDHVISEIPILVDPRCPADSSDGGDELSSLIKETILTVGDD